MKTNPTIGEIITRYIKLRGKTIKEIAFVIGIKEKTFYDEIQKGRITAHRLFQLTWCLDMDLEWMMSILGYQGHSDVFDFLKIPRMKEDMKIQEMEKLEQLITTYFEENFNDITFVKRELLKSYELFYLLDVLLPETCKIYIFEERGIELYFIDFQTVNFNNKVTISLKRTRLPGNLINGNEALSIALLSRREG